MTSERFKDEIDHLDSGLPDHPDTLAYMRDGRAARRRRQGIVALGAGALVAAVVTPAVMWGGGTTTTGPTGDVAADPSAAASSEPAPVVVPVDEGFGDTMRAAIEQAVPQATYAGQELGDHWIEDGRADRVAVESPPNWPNVFSWRQDYAVEGLQYFDVHSEWRRVSGGIRACAGVSFEVEKSCDTSDSGGGVTTVLHDGVHLAGEPDGDWARMVEVISPTSDSGATHVTQVWAQVEGMTWAEADAALPPIGQLAMVANLDEVVLPEPVEIAIPMP